MGTSGERNSAQEIHGALRKWLGTRGYPEAGSGPKAEGVREGSHWKEQSIKKTRVCKEPSNPCLREALGAVHGTRIRDGAQLVDHVLHSGRILLSKEPFLTFLCTK